MDNHQPPNLQTTLNDTYSAASVEITRNHVSGPPTLIFLASGVRASLGALIGLGLLACWVVLMLAVVAAVVVGEVLNVSVNSGLVSGGIMVALFAMGVLALTKWSGQSTAVVVVVVAGPASNPTEVITLDAQGGGRIAIRPTGSIRRIYEPGTRLSLGTDRAWWEALRCTIGDDVYYVDGTSTRRVRAALLADPR